MTPDFITWMPKVTCKAWPGNTPLRHLPERFALLSRLEKLWRLYSRMLRELYWLTILSIAAPSQEPSTFIWSSFAKVMTKNQMGCFLEHHVHGIALKRWRKHKTKNIYEVLWNYDCTVLKRARDPKFMKYSGKAALNSVRIKTSCL